MPAHIVRAYHCQYNQLDEKEIHFLVMGESVQRIYKQAEGNRIRYGADIIKLAFRAFLLLGRCLMPRNNAVSPNGTLIANNQCQLAIERIPLATEGPAAADMATTIALIPIPRPIWLFG